MDIVGMIREELADSKKYMELAEKSHGAIRNYYCQMSKDENDHAHALMEIAEATNVHMPEDLLAVHSAVFYR